MTEPTYTPQRIILKGLDSEVYEEGRVGAGQTFTPGMLIEQDSDATYKGDSEFKTYKVHATATGAGPKAIVIESVFRSQPDGGANTGGTIDDTIAATDLVRFHICQPGDIIYGFLATGNNALPGSKLASNGDGTFRVSTTNPMFEAIDTLNNTSGVKKRLRMRAL